MKFKDAIFELPNMISPEFCDEVIKFIQFEDLQNLTVGIGEIDTDIRNVQGISGYHFLYDEHDSEEMKKKISLLMFFHKIRKNIMIPFINYNTKFQHIESDLRLLQADFLEYSEGGHYSTHTDDHKNYGRQLTMIINLNNDYEGGDFCLYNPIGKKDNEEIMYRTKLGKGSVLMFPSNYLYPHRIEPITKGKRYSVVCWMG